MPDPNDASATIGYVTGLQAPDGGFSPYVATGPTIPATLAAVRVLNYLGAAIPNLTQCQNFVLSCIDSSNGGIKLSPDGQPDVYTTSVGTLALVELGIASDDICNAILGYLRANTQNYFTYVYFAAFAWEAIHDAFPEVRLPDDTRLNWLITIEGKNNGKGKYGVSDEMVEATAEAVASKIRLDAGENYDLSAKFLLSSQNPDGGYGKSNGSDSSVIFTYEVMRAFDQLSSIPGQNQVCPLDPDGVTKFVASCGKSDGGYGDPPNDPSSAANPTYFAISTLHILKKEGCVL